MKKTLLDKELWFLYSLFLIPVIAYLNPSIGAAGGLLHSEIYSKFFLAVIFFMSGLSFSKVEFMSALKNVKLTIVIQTLCFIVIPLLMFLLSHTLFKWSGMNPSFLLGTLILASVPITTTSCVIFTAMARGDTVASLFNATLSNFIGVFTAPITIGFFLGLSSQSISFNPLPIIEQLFLIIILPTITGQLANHFFRHWLPPNTEVFFANLSKVLLLFIIYSAFCDSFTAIGHLDSPWAQLILLIFWMIFSNLLFVALSAVLGRLLQFSEAQRKSLIFTAPQKTIVVGLPLNLAILQFATFPNGEIQPSFLLLPLLIYNNLQWVVSALLIRYFNPKQS